MTTSLRFGLVLCSGLLSLAAGAPALAQGHKGHGGGGHSHAGASGHGGQVTMTKAHHFEVLFLRDAVRVYAYDMDQKPIDASGIKGTVKLKFRTKGKKSQTASFSYVKPKKDGHSGHGNHGGSGYLQAKVNLAKVSDGEAKATLSFEGLSNGKERKVSFRETVNQAKAVAYECPMKCLPAGETPGKCPKCGMTLAAKTFTYACSMHPEVTSHEPGAKCWKCGMRLMKKAAGEKGAGGHGGAGHGKHGGH